MILRMTTEILSDDTIVANREAARTAKAGKLSNAHIVADTNIFANVVKRC